MSTLKAASVVAALLLAAQSAPASIPPPLAPVVLSSDKSALPINRAYLEFLAQNGHFQIADAPLAGWQVAPCIGGKAMASSCIRQKLRATPVNKQEPPVALLVGAREGDSYQWTCIGAGEQAGDAAKQSVSIDLKTAMFGEGPARAEMHRKAVNCLFSAAAEADGIIQP